MVEISSKSLRSLCPHSDYSQESSETMTTEKMTMKQLETTVTRLIKLSEQHPQPEPTPHTGVRLIRCGHRGYALVDEDDYEVLNRWTWTVKAFQGCHYALRKYVHYGKTNWIRMHREIMNHPKGKEVHHKNHDTLDNRKCNLVALTPEEHKREAQQYRISHKNNLDT